MCYLEILYFFPPSFHPPFVLSLSPSFPLSLFLSLYLLLLSISLSFPLYLPLPLPIFLSILLLPLPSLFLPLPFFLLPLPPFVIRSSTSSPQFVIITLQKNRQSSEICGGPRESIIYFGLSMYSSLSSNNFSSGGNLHASTPRSKQEHPHTAENI